MLNRYKLIITNKSLYEEIEIDPQNEVTTIGTGIDCDVRLRKESFFGQIELTVRYSNGKWQLYCSENLYLTVGDVRKLLTKELSHGEELAVKYRDSDAEAMRIYFTLDFEYEHKDYSKVIDISGYDRIAVGGNTKCDIKLYDQNLGGDYFLIERRNNKIYVRDSKTQYGVFVNGVRIKDHKQINDCDFVSVVGFSFYYKEGKLYTANQPEISADGLNSWIISEQTSHFQYPNFNRNTRIQYVIPEDEIEIKQPLPKPQKNKKSLLITILPTLAMLVLLIVVRGFMGNGSMSGGSFILYSAGSMSIGVIVSLITYQQDKKELQKETKEREESYLKYIAEKEKLIQDSRANELRIRENIYSSLTESIQEAQNFEKRLFEKTSKDKDFLDVYLGRGRVEASTKIKFTKQDFVDPDDPISLLPEELATKYKYIEGAPIIAHLNSSDAIGVVGNPNQLHEIMKNITLDLSLRHFYKEVKTYYMLDEDEMSKMSWLRWLKHAYNDQLKIRNFMCDDESRKILMESLYAELVNREAIKAEEDGVEWDIHYVIFIKDSKFISNHPMSRYVEKCNQYGFTFIFFEEYEEFLPKGCTEIIRLGDTIDAGAVLNSGNGDVIYPFNCENVSDKLAESVAIKIGAVSVPEVSLESQLTRNITMFQLLDILSTDDLNLEERWEKSQVYKSLAAPLGVKAKNEIVYLDISDKASAHGPHGLVAGTTGSGKSEILQTYVLSMATLFHPYEVGFVIIDFKGGGMANQFSNLPHLMGTITNIDGREINRSLLSIKAELVKRQSCFAKVGVNHINDYIKLFKKGEVEEPLPHLIMICDEFAELKAEFPDFMKEIISAARIGRTLGVHLILATQKPAGVVDNQIWSNSKFKLCLKVQTKEDSNEVIKTPLAAEIKEPGRAYFQVGNNEVFELFQSAYSGAKVIDSSSNAKAVELYELNAWGKRTLVYTNKKKKANDDAPTELEAIVDYIEKYCKDKRIRKLDGICLPSLADTIIRDSLPEYKPDITKGVIAPIGLYDDPENQTQDNYLINFSDSNTYIIGSPQCGKTTLLQTIILQIMKYYSPAECSIYIIDCGNMSLKTFEESNHVGGVVLSSEEERVSNLFKMINALINSRKQMFAAKGLGTYSAYVEAGFRDVPQVLFIIDNIAAFREYYGGYDDYILSISREGQSLGINMIVTATQTNALNYRALSNYGNRIALNCNDTGEYTNLFDRCRIEPKDTPGRGLCSLEKHIVEFQTVLCVSGEKEIDRVQNIKREIEKANAQFEGIKATPIPSVPDVIKRSDLIKDNPSIYRQSYCIPVGMDYDSISYRFLNLAEVGLFGITGRAKSGKDNFVRHILSAIQLNLFGSLTKAYIMDDHEMKLESCGDYGYVEKYSVDAGETEIIVNEIYEQLRERQQMIIDNRGTPADVLLQDQPLLMLVVNNRAFYDTMGADKELYKKFSDIVKLYRSLKVVIILSAVENAAVGFNAPDIYKYLKENKKLFVFEDAANIKFIDVSVKQQKENVKPIRLGDGFMVFDSEFTRIKTILDD